MISLVLTDALQGVDVAGRYPAFFRRLRVDPELALTYHDALDLLTADAAGQLRPLPGPPSRDLSFLAQSTIRPQLQVTAPDHWCITWCPTLSQRAGWTWTFRPEGMPDWDEATWTPIFRSGLAVELWGLAVSLEGRGLLAMDDYSKADSRRPMISFALAVQPLREVQSAVGWRALEGRWLWGDNEARAAVGQDGRAQVQMAQQLVTADFCFSLMTTRSLFPPVFTPV